MAFHGAPDIETEQLKIIILYNDSPMNKYLFVSFALLVSISCESIRMGLDRTYHAISICNHYQSSISYCFNIDSVDFNKGYYYSGFRLPNSPLFVGQAILPNTKQHDELWIGSWKKYFKDFEYYSIFILDIDTLNNSSWQDIQKGNKFMVRFDLSEYDISKLETREEEGYLLTLSFPPDERMKDIHMYPPYEEVLAKYGK